MNISTIKMMRRQLCKTVGHDFENLVCRRCKKHEFPFMSRLEPSIGCTGIVSKDVEIKTQSSEPTIGDVKFDMELQKIVLYDGKNWKPC